MPDQTLDREGWLEIKPICESEKASQGSQKAIIKEMVELYFMDWDEHKTDPTSEIKRTISPDPHNKVRGAADLLTSTSPHFDIPKPKNDQPAADKASQLEKMATMIWERSNKVQGTKVERELAKAALLSDQIYIQIISTQDLVDAAQEAADKATDPRAKAYANAALRRAKEKAALTPLIFEPIDPLLGYPIRAGRELIAFYKEMKTTIRDVRAKYGDHIAEGKKDIEETTLHDYYDEVYRYVWIDVEKDPLVAGQHGLDFLPVIAWTPEGSLMFDRKDRQIEPFLSTLKKSGLWERQNLVLTAVATNLAKMINAGFVFSPGTADAQLNTIRHNVIGNVVNVGVGGNLRPMSKEILDQNIMGFFDIINGLADESTLYDQSLGQAMGSGTTFSMYAMVVRTGMLPIVPVQQALGDAIGAAMETAFKWLKYTGKRSAISQGYKETLEIKPSEIPDTVEFDVTVEVDLPQDALENANIFNILDGKVSKEWLLENVLKVGQPEDQRRQIWREQASDMAAEQVFQNFMQQMLQKLQQAQAQAQAPQEQLPPGGEQAEGMPPEGMEAEGMPPEGMPEEGEPNEQATLQGLPRQRISRQPMTRPMSQQIPPDMEAPQ